MSCQGPYVELELAISIHHQRFESMACRLWLEVWYDFGATRSASLLAWVGTSPLLERPLPTQFTICEGKGTIQGLGPSAQAPSRSTGIAET